jgi:ATP adenylyltransferase
MRDAPGRASRRLHVTTRKSKMLVRKGTLRDALLRATERALRIGALLPVPTEYDFVEDGGVRFFVRVLQTSPGRMKKRKNGSGKAEW